MHLNPYAHIGALPFGAGFAAQFSVSTCSACGSPGALASGQRQRLQWVSRSPVRSQSEGCEDVRQELASLNRELVGPCREVVPGQLPASHGQRKDVQMWALLVAVDDGADDVLIAGVHPCQTRGPKRGRVVLRIPPIADTHSKLIADSVPWDRGHRQ